MRTRPDATAALAASAEADTWADLAGDVSGCGLDDMWFERVVIPQVDPGRDLDRRSSRWSHRLADHGLVGLLGFAAGLAAAEADAWRALDAVTATQAHEDRRFLLTDRVVHWAVPLLLSAGLDEPATRMLEIGDRLRLVPVETVGEGLQLPGHDSYGPITEPPALADRLGTVWGGWFWTATPPADLGAAYREAQHRWTGLAGSHGGSAALWIDLARRAAMTAELSRHPSAR